jgi:hypothetical protein
MTLSADGVFAGKRCQAFQIDERSVRNRYGYCIRTAYHKGPHEVGDPDFDVLADRFLTWESK